MTDDAAALAAALRAVDPDAVSDPERPYFETWAEAILAALNVSGAMSPTVSVADDPDGAGADVRHSGVEPFGAGLGDMVGAPRGEPSGARHPASVGTGHGTLPSPADGVPALGAASRFHETSVTVESSLAARGDAKCSVCGRDIFRAWIDGKEQPWKHWVEPVPDGHAATPEPTDIH